jgi:hypothetical protein
VNEIEGVTHSCCPGKRDLHAPAFTLTDTLRLPAGRVMYQYQCSGCQTVVHVLVQLSQADQIPVR